MELGLTIAADATNSRVVFGFSSEMFSQAVFLPVTTIDEAQHFALGIYNAIVTASEEVLGIPTPVKVDNATIADNPS